MTASESLSAVPVRNQKCPFCGATPHHGLGKVQHCSLHGDPFQEFSVWCPHRCAKITRRTGDLAWDAWNKRPGFEDTRLEGVRMGIEAAAKVAESWWIGAEVSAKLRVHLSQIDVQEIAKGAR